MTTEPMLEFEPQTPRELDEEANIQLVTFSQLLDSIEMDEKLKLLWKQIYQNAVTDRKNALMIWTDLYMVVHGNPEMHTMHGDRIAKYMERMEKSNAQLIKLAELVQKLKDKEEEELPRGNSLFDRLEKHKNSS